MAKSLIALVVGASVAIGAIPSPTAADARWRHHRHGVPVAPIVGGLAAAAIVGAALSAQRPHYDSYGWYEPAYFGSRCYVRRERFWDGWRWHVRSVRDCY